MKYRIWNSNVKKFTNYNFETDVKLADQYGNFYGLCTGLYDRDNYEICECDYLLRHDTWYELKHCQVCKCLQLHAIDYGDSCSNCDGDMSYEEFAKITNEFTIRGNSWENYGLPDDADDYISNYIEDYN